MKYQPLSSNFHTKPERPIKVVQFGEGNFLRAFADCFIQYANDNLDYNGSIAIIKPTSRGNTDLFDEQENLYNIVIRGVQDGKKVEEIKLVDSIDRVVNPYTDFGAYRDLAHCDTLECIISNTTEAGIVFDDSDLLEDTPASTFPGKLTQFLYDRYCWFDGNTLLGVHILPCELIDNNADVLRDCILKYAHLWQLPQDFEWWLENACAFHNTLVDRIVSGFPHQEADSYFERLGYEDKLLTVTEPFALWVIEEDKDKLRVSEASKTSGASDSIDSGNLPQARCGDLPILLVKSVKPYKERKVRILNGAHTSFAMLAWMLGHDYVRQAMDDSSIRQYVTGLLSQEVIPYLTLPKEELDEFANSVLERFENPFMDHALLDIALNSVSKWATRCLPSLLTYYRENGTCPPRLAFSLAALLEFYRSTARETDGKEHTVKDTDAVLSFFSLHEGISNYLLVADYLRKKDFHGVDLSEIAGLEAQVTHYLDMMEECGVAKAFCDFLGGLSDEDVHEDK